MMKEYEPILSVVGIWAICVGVLFSNFTDCSGTEPDLPYPELEDVPLVIQEYLVDQLGPCDAIWTVDVACNDYDFCRVHLICQSDAPNTLVSVNLDLYCPDIEAVPGDSDRRPCSLAPPTFLEG